MRTCRVQDLPAVLLRLLVRAETEIETATAVQLQPPDPVTAAPQLQPPQVKPVMDTNHEKKEAGKSSIRVSTSNKVSLCSRPITSTGATLTHS
jgi:hypothetical protein